MAQTDQGSGKGKQPRPGGSKEPISVEDFDQGPSSKPAIQGETCGQCHVNPVLSWQVTYVRSGREIIDTKYFYEGRPEDNVKLCTECSVKKADAVVGKEMSNISRNFGSVITTITGNELAGHAYHAFGVNAPEIMKEVEGGADIIDVVTKCLRALAVSNNAWADERQRFDRRISIPADETIVREAVQLALSMKDGKLATVTNLIGDRLVAIEEKYPNLRFDIIISDARNMKVDVTLALTGILIADAKKATEAYRGNPDGESLYDRLMTLDKERVMMTGDGTGRRERVSSDGRDKSEFDLFVEARKLYEQARALQGAQQRRDVMQQTYRGRFSNAFRTTATPTSQTGDAPATLADTIDPGTKAALEEMAAQSDPDSVPAALSNDADPDSAAETDDTASDTTADKPAAVENNA